MAQTRYPAAPLLCAGIIGFRSLRRAAVPPGGRLGIYGFGASAHLAAQVALAEGATVHVMTRSPAARRLALDLGATSAGDTFDRGGTLAIAGIYLSEIPVLNYADHLFYERQVRSVAAKTQRDGEEFLAISSRISIQVTTVPYRLEDADVALRDLAHDRVTGAAVLIVAAG